MICNIHLLCFILICFGTINALPRYRYRRQVNLPQNNGPFNEGISARYPAGSIVGSYYYGVGADPNYGSFIKRPNTAGGNIFAISYDPDSDLFSNLINPSHQHQSSQQMSSSNNKYYYNNAWQRPWTNNYYYRFGNRYPPGSQGWYATGGNYYWYNNGQFILPHPYLFIINIVLLVFCK